ncbi:GNAT family N-acetyltransferase [Uliginosibacterium sediminicola]|uniref:GNAT family N-acetyltransferase n=1 Tax=Uliginosibacterium sediminicola TaxID=2024550 RepID=A0ABU9YZZ2_9RHOO
MQMPLSYSIRQAESHEFDQFLVYVNDLLSDNGRDGLGYFQPLSRSESRFPSERAAGFRTGLEVPFSQAGWRRLWVLRNANEKIIGHIDLRAHAERFAEHRCLLGMGVDRDHRNLGLGTRLIEHGEEWVKANASLEWIDLQVLSSNEKAIRLYEKCGFVRTGETPEMFRIDGQSFSYTAMTKLVG